MIRPEDDELIHRALDGALSPGEAEQFRARLAADPDLGARAEQLERLAAAVDGLGPEEPPSGFSDRVMAEVAAVRSPRPAWHRRLASLPAAIGRQLFPWFAHRSQQGSHSSDSFRKAGMAGGGVIVAKKALWGVAGLAVVVILAVVYFNGRTVDQGAQGAIGAADRYRGAQPSGVSAKPGNAQAFLQSDTFDKIIKNKEIRSLLADPEVCALLASDAVEAALKDGDVDAALKDAKLLAALADGDVQTALADQEVVAALADADVEAALMDDAVDAALMSEAMEAALRDRDTARLLADPDIQAALGDKKGLLKLFEEAQAAMKGARVKGGNEKALQGRLTAVEAAIRSNKLFAAMMADEAVQAALQNGDRFVAMISDESFEAALKAQNGLLSKLLTDEAFQANIKGMAALCGDDAFEAALRGQAAVKGQAAMQGDAADAALKARAGLRSFAALLGDPDFQAALRDPSFAALIGNPDFEAALKDRAALQAALKDVR